MPLSDTEKIMLAIDQSIQLSLIKNAIRLIYHLFQIETGPKLLLKYVPFLYQNKEWELVLLLTKDKSNSLQTYYQLLCQEKLTQAQIKQNNILNLQNVIEQTESLINSWKKTTIRNQNCLDNQILSVYYLKKFKQESLQEYSIHQQLLQKSLALWEFNIIAYKHLNELQFKQRAYKEPILGSVLKENTQQQITKNTVNVNSIYSTEQTEYMYDTSKQLAYLKSNLVKFSRPILLLNQIAFIYMKRADYQQSYTFFEQSLKLLPNQKEIVSQYSTILWQLQKQEQLRTLAYYHQVFYSNTYQSLIILGNQMSLSKNHQQAIDCFQKAAALKKKSGYAKCLLAHEYFSLQQYGLAKMEYQSSITVGPIYYIAYFGIGNIHLKREDPFKALKYFDLAIQINKECPLCYLYKGICHQQAKELEKAIKNFQKAESMNDRILLTKLKIAEVLYEQHQYLESLKYLRFLKTLVPNDVELLVLLAQVLLKLDQKQKALQYLNKASILDPKDQYRRIKNLQHSVTESK